MSRNLVVCCDGTWNAAWKTEEPKRSNVWWFYQAAAGESGKTKVYFDGLGTKGSPKERALGGMFGRGVSDAICRAYGWLAQHYRKGDKIFLIGFSRGAFTVRSLAGFIGCRGLSTGLENMEEKDLAKAVAEEYRSYRRSERRPAPSPAIHFVGVFDTVGAMGVPNEWRLLNKFDKPRQFKFHDTQLGAVVINGRHAVSIDESRAVFSPTLWTDPETNQTIYDWEQNGRSIKQLWFCGRHSDVGGGENRALTDIALRWMLAEANGCGLTIDMNVRGSDESDELGELTGGDSAIPWTCMPRSVPILAPENTGTILHRSVMLRRQGLKAYWPTVVLNKQPLACEIKLAGWKEWQPAGIYLEGGKTYLAEKAQGFGGIFLHGYVANGRNPQADGTWAEHQRFRLGKPFVVKEGAGGYLYFKLDRNPFAGGISKDAKMRAMRLLSVAIRQVD